MIALCWLLCNNLRKDASNRCSPVFVVYFHCTKSGLFLVLSLRYYLTLSYLNNYKMSYKGPQKIQKVMVQPINLIFRYLQNRSRVQVWLYENVNLRIEGHIIGFDEYMNIVMDEAEEYNIKSKNRRPLGRIMMKGDNITLIQNVNPQAMMEG